MAASNEIILMGDIDRYEEAKIASGQTLYPGMMCDINSSGELVVVGTAGLDVPTRIVLADTLQGKTKTDAYTAGTVCRYYIPRPGDLVNLYCLSGATINIATKVICNNAGKGIATTGTPAKTIGTSEEAAGTLAADGHVKVRIG